MTIQDKTRFKQAFNRLAVAVRLPADQADTSMQQVYWDGLNDLPLDAVEDAARDLALGSQWFPKLAEWRDSAIKAKHGRVIKMALPAPQREPWRAECETCDDTGWEQMQCDGSDICGRRKDHAKHGYVVPCVCRPTNRTYQRRLAEQQARARGRKEAAEQGKGKWAN